MSAMKPPYPIIREKLFSGKVIPFLGSGASLRASCGMWEKCNEESCYFPEKKCLGHDAPVDADHCLPKAGELACYLARRAEFPRDESIELTKVAQYYESVAAGRPPLNEELHSIFIQDPQINSLHTLLAEVQEPLLIVTTNYDDLIEQAFIKKGIKYDLMLHDDNQSPGGNLLIWRHDEKVPVKVLPKTFDIEDEMQTTNTSIIYKMHGTVNRLDQAKDQYVITENDYIEFLARMTISKAIPHSFFEFSSQRHFLFLGYSLNDWNLRVALNRIMKGRTAEQNIKSWAIQIDPSQLEEKLWATRGVQLYNVALHEFVEKLVHS
jgi:hypothetical protein